MWLQLTLACSCVEWCDCVDLVSRKEDTTKQLKPLLTAHYFRHNTVTLLYERGIDTLAVMKIVGHRDCRTTAYICTHLKDETIRQAGVDMAPVFKSKR